MKAAAPSSSLGPPLFETGTRARRAQRLNGPERVHEIRAFGST